VKNFGGIGRCTKIRVFGKKRAQLTETKFTPKGGIRKIENKGRRRSDEVRKKNLRQGTGDVCFSSPLGFRAKSTDESRRRKLLFLLDGRCFSKDRRGDGVATTNAQRGLGGGV